MESNVKEEIQLLKYQLETMGNPTVIYKLWDEICAQKDTDSISEALYAESKKLIFERIDFLKKLENSLK